MVVTWLVAAHPPWPFHPVKLSWAPVESVPKEEIFEPPSLPAMTNQLLSGTGAPAAEPELPAPHAPPREGRERGARQRAVQPP